MTAVEMAPDRTAYRPNRAAMAGRRQVGWWLVGMCALLFTMIVVGGATRLTESGLSITEWRPVTGALPPLSADAWQEEFDKYRQIPEYQLINKGMSMAEFQYIYWWEWGHRFLGRLIGLAFAAGFAYFLIARKLDRPLTIKLAAMFVLGGLQGALGWYMVQSGLVDRVDVSQYRLVAHLGLAFAILAFMTWVALDLLIGERGKVRAGAAPGLPALSLGVTALCFVQILAGGFVAGLRAGLTYNTWPLMDGAFIPGGLFMQSPWIVNFFENVTTVQFTHRIGAYILAALVGLLVWLAWRRPVGRGARQAVLLLGLAVTGQILLGIWALLAVVPISLGVAHQAGAVLVFAAALHAAYRLTPARRN